MIQLFHTTPRAHRPFSEILSILKYWAFPIISRLFLSFSFNEFKNLLSQIRVNVNGVVKLMIRMRICVWYSAVERHLYRVCVSIRVSVRVRV